jgi:transcriptional regulator with XRE-family HTH domain
MSEAPRRPLGPAGNNLRRNIQRQRIQRRWSYRDVEERLSEADCAISTLGLSAIERGARHVTADDLVAFATIYSLSIEELLQPPADCWTCHGAPPAGYMCLECETSRLPA